MKKIPTSQDITNLLYDELCSLDVEHIQQLVQKICKDYKVNKDYILIGLGEKHTQKTQIIIYLNEDSEISVFQGQYFNYPSPRLHLTEVMDKHIYCLSYNEIKQIIKQNKKPVFSLIQPDLKYFKKDELVENVYSFNENLEISVKYQDQQFDVSCRYFIGVDLNKSVTEPQAIWVSPEPGWRWDEFADLPKEQSHILEQLLGENGDIEIPFSMKRVIYKRIQNAFAKSTEQA